MKIIQPSYKFETPINGEYGQSMLRLIESASRTCYKSEGACTDTSAGPFVRKIAQVKKHVSVVEHANVTVRFICDRGVTHELVRHRLAAYSQESTRYVSSVDKKQFLIDSDDDVVEAYQRGLSMKRIASLAGRDEHQIWDILHAHDIPSRSRNSPGKVNHNFFESIDTPEKAYLLGMIQADGSLRKEGSHQITITQHSDYFWYLRRMFRTFICNGLGFGIDRQCKTISIVSDKMWHDLSSNGVVPDKSFVQTDSDADALWSAISPALIPDFLRGFLDGDGSVRFFQQNNQGHTESVNLNWNGHKRLLDHVQSWLNTTYGYSANVHLHSGRLHRLAITSPGCAVQVCKDMYRNFKFPYGHPKKACRIMEVIGWNYPVAEWGDPKFQVIMPCWWVENRMDVGFWIWMAAMDNAEDTYLDLTELGASPQEARSVLPNSLKTEIVMTCNLREWRHVFTLRAAKEAHPQMQQLMRPLLAEFKRWLPELFDDIHPEIPSTETPQPCK